MLSLADAWPWLALAGLGMFHGANPAMGWLFAVALGLHRQNGRIVLLALLPIAVGHMLAIALAVALLLALGTIVDLSLLAVASGIALIAWAAWHWFNRHPHPRIGMTTPLMGLAAWSFLMASAHGAGVMILPALLPLQAAHAHSHGLGVESLLTAALAVAVHSIAMIVTTGVIAVLVYRWLGLAVLKRAWINFDLLWSAMLLITGTLLIYSYFAA